MEMISAISIFTCIFLIVYLLGTRLMSKGKALEEKKSLLRKEKVFGTFTPALAQAFPHSKAKMSDLGRSCWRLGTTIQPRSITFWRCETLA